MHAYTYPKRQHLPPATPPHATPSHLPASRHHCLAPSGSPVLAQVYSRREHLPARTAPGAPPVLTSTGLYTHSACATLGSSGDCRVVGSTCRSYGLTTFCRLVTAGVTMGGGAGALCAMPALHTANYLPDIICALPYACCACSPCAAQQNHPAPPLPAGAVAGGYHEVTGTTDFTVFTHTILEKPHLKNIFTLTVSHYSYARSGRVARERGTQAGIPGERCGMRAAVRRGAGVSLSGRCHSHSAWWHTHRLPQTSTYSTA